MKSKLSNSDHLRIGEFSDTFFPIVDGVGRVVYNYANTLAKKGQECYVVAPMAESGYRGDMPFELVDFISTSVPLQRQYNSGIPLLDPHYDKRMSQIQLDIIHAHSPFIAGQEAWRLSRWRNIPLVGTFHSRYYDDFYKFTKAEMLADIGVKYVVSFFEHCDEVWTVSNSSADTLRDYGYKGDIIVMQNGTPDTEPEPERALNAKKHFGLNDDPILLYCGQINWKKNILRILEACAFINDTGRKFQLVLAGQGPDLSSIKKKCKELGISDKTVFTGHIMDEKLLYGLYEASLLFVFPSLYDTSGMVVREAAAMQTCSVVVKGSAAAEPICDHESGFLCEDTSESLSQVLEYALDNLENTKRMGERARKDIYISWFDIMDEVIDRYKRLIKKKSEK